MELLGHCVDGPFHKEASTASWRGKGTGVWERDGQIGVSTMRPGLEPALPLRSVSREPRVPPLFELPWVEFLPLRHEPSLTPRTRQNAPLQARALLSNRKENGPSPHL